MELNGKIKISLAVSFLSILLGCATSSKQERPLVLTELTPTPKAVQIKKPAIYEPVYGYMRVLEITQTNGVQSELMAKAGDLRDKLEKGVMGEISSDSSFGEIIGTFSVVSVLNGFVICKIENVTRKIPNNAYIRIQTGQKLKEE